jgi:hypothetical protein
LLDSALAFSKSLPRYFKISSVEGIRELTGRFIYKRDGFRSGMALGKPPANDPLGFAPSLVLAIKFCAEFNLRAAGIDRAG